MQSQDTLDFQQYLAVVQSATEFGLASPGLTYQSWSAMVQGETKLGLADEFVLALRPLIEKTASGICTRFMVSRQVRVDFIAGSVADVLAPYESRYGKPLPPRVTKYNPSIGKFRSWLFKVLYRLLIDQLKKNNRREAREDQYKSYVGGIPGPHTEKSDQNFVHDQNSPFTSSDLGLLEKWKTPPVILFAVFDLRHKLPNTIWQRWCQEVSLPIPFPPESNIPNERADWVNLIAKLLAVSPNNIHTKLNRQLKQLKKEPLDFFRRIKDDK